MLIEIDGFKLDASKFSKSFIYRHVNDKVEITFTLDFPPYSETKLFDTDNEAKQFINEIKKEGDKVKYK